MTVRVLFVANSATYFRTHQLELARALVAQGFDVGAVVPASPPADRLGIERAGIAVYTYPYAPARTNPLLEIPTFIALWRIYRQIRPTVVHHLTVKPVLYGGIIARLTGIPVRINAVLGLGHFFNAPGLRARSLRTLSWPFFRFALAGRGGAVIVQNADDQAFFAEALGKSNGASRVHLIRGSGVDVACFDANAVEEDPPIALFAGRLLRSKGLVDFVEAARRLKATHPAVRFVVCGDVVSDNPAAIEEERIRSWVEEGVIEWWGRRDDMPAVLGKAAMVTLPSWYGEGVPRTLIEAAAAARPIVTTDSPGCREIVRDGVNGLLVPPRDVSALADALGRLLVDAGERSRMGREGRRIVEREFSLDLVIRETIGLYDEMLADVEKGVLTVNLR